MASGILGFLGFGKKDKPNLTPSRQYPDASLAPNYQSLNDLSKQRIQAGITGQETPGVGFGPDFLGKATNPAIANIDYNFQNRTLPQLNSELSKRGVARSAGAGLATDVIGRADQQRNLDVNNLMSQFFTLNKQQKKNDITQGIGVGQGQDSEFLNQQNLQAQAAENQVNRNVSQANLNNQNALNRQNQTLQAAGQGISMLGGTQGVQSLLSKIGLSPSLGTSGVKTNISGSDQPSIDEVDRLLQLYGM